jgi:branched-chain amino acid transport system ATP-binding protein
MTGVVAPLLSVKDLCAGYGVLSVVDGVSLNVSAGGVAAIIGRNGAGKTTTLLAIAGMRYGCNAGKVTLGTRDLSKTAPRQVVRAGVAIVPEGHPVFRSMTVADNLKLGAFWRRRRDGAKISSALDRVYELFPALKDARGRAAGSLSGGQQQMLAIGQALMQQPKILLLDEPSSGLAPAVVDNIYDAVRRLADDGQGILLVEQNIDRAMAAASYLYVMERGVISLETSVADLTDAEAIARVVRGVA